MKKSVVLLSLLSLCFIPLSFTYALKKKSKAPCPDAVKQGTQLPQKCKGVTIICPAVALANSNVSTRCTMAGITTLCPVYSEKPPSVCSYITQSPPNVGGSTTGGSEVGAIPEGPPPISKNSYHAKPVKPTPPQLIKPTYCNIVRGEKHCTTCRESSRSANIDTHDKKVTKSCETCITRKKRLVPRIHCNSDADCGLAKADCCTGCGSIAIHKSQYKKYKHYLNKECNPPQKPGEPMLQGACICGSSYPAPKYKAVCRRTDWKVPDSPSNTTCIVSTTYPQSQDLESGESSDSVQ